MINVFNIQANKTKWQAAIEKEEKKTSYEYIIKRVKDTFLEIADQEERVLTKNKGWQMKCSCGLTIIKPL